MNMYNKFINKKFKIIILYLVFLSFTNLIIAENNYIKIKQINNQWYFIDPAGNQFILKGIHHVSYNSDGEIGTKKRYYNEFVDKHYKNYNDWAVDTVKTIKEYGFNAIGNWSSFDVLRDKIYYTVILYLPRGGWFESGVDDYFCDDYKNNAEKIIKESIENNNFKQDKNLIGYFLGGELKWSGDWRGFESIFIDYLNMSANQNGKIEMINFLKTKYNNDIKKLNFDFFTNFNNWESALNYTKFKMTVTKNAKDIEQEAIYLIAKQFYKVSCELLKKYDNNHLILGSMLLAPITPGAVLKASAEYVDVVSVNFYPLILDLHLTLPYLTNNIPTRDSLNEFYKITKKPILISEFGFRAYTNNTPSSRPVVYPTFCNQKQRGLYAYNYISSFLKKEYMCGFILFQWFDQPKKGADYGAGENNNWGFVNLNNEIYTEYAEYLKKANFKK